MPQVFWATCPSCLVHFKRKDSPKLETVGPVTFADVKSMVDEAGGGGQGAERQSPAPRRKGK